MKKLFFLLILISHTSYSQDYGNNTDALKLCSVLKSNNFGTDSMAEGALERILNTIGASKRFVLQPCDNINNAVATSYKGIRYILYDRDFMYSLDNGSNWGNLFILAHEVGHHINGHSLDLVLYAADAVEAVSLSQSRIQELEADEFAGFVLAKLGGPISAANEVISKISNNSDDSYNTHPSRNKRLNAVTKGYNLGIGKKAIVYETTTTLQKADEYLYSAFAKLTANDIYGAISDYTKSIEYNPNNVVTYYNLGVIFSQYLDDGEKAEMYYDKAILVDPSYADSYLNMAAVILEKEQVIIDEMNSLGTSASENRRYDALNRNRQKMFRTAMRYLENYLVFEPTNKSALRTLRNIKAALD